MSREFYRLAPFIQEFVYRHGWTELREVQIAASQVLFDSDAHLLLASGTASGKTEAAFLPVLTLLHQDPACSIGALYIGPTKALINDQFQRLKDLLDEADLPVWHWHGDVASSKKSRMLRTARGILQITPESLESMLINRTGELQRLFHDLRFVIIDEVHVFMSSDRGQQIICQLERLRRYQRREPRRIGLSATLSDYEQAERWLASGSRRAVRTPRIAPGGQRLRLSLEHWLRPERDDPESLPEPVDDPYYQHIFEQVQGGKCLVFANNRGETESVVAALRQIAAAQRLPDVYHVHHGSISASLREAAEQAMREPDQPAVTAATVTLELGIDLGQLERVVQLDAPLSVSSFLQRLGRSGRRGRPPEMRLVTSEEAFASGHAADPFPWQLLQAIAVIQLYLEERWIEPVQPARLPFSLLYHQTMSALLAAGELQPEDLARRVLNLTPFRQISPADYRLLLLHLLEIDHLQRMEEGSLIVGLTGERVARDFRFFAVFADSDEYVVQDESREIGSISSPPEVGERLALAGRSWEVVDVIAQRRLVLVKPALGRTAIAWPGGGANIHDRVMQRMRQVLLEDEVYRYLQPQAKQRLHEARLQARAMRLDRRQVVPVGKGACAIYPWMGSRAFRTLERLLKTRGRRACDVQSITGVAPYSLLVETVDGQPETLKSGILRLASRLDHGSLLREGERPQLNKFDSFIPTVLLQKAFLQDHLDITGLQAALRYW